MAAFCPNQLASRVAHRINCFVAAYSQSNIFGDLFEQSAWE